MECIIVFDDEWKEGRRLRVEGGDLVVGWHVSLARGIGKRIFGVCGV